VPRRARILALALLTGCSSGGQSSDAGVAAVPSPTSTPPPPASSVPSAPTPTGTLVGRVVYRGPRPRPATVPVERGREACGRSQTIDALVLSRDGGVSGAVVSLDGPPRGVSDAPSVVFDQVGCRYVPHVATATVGAPIEFRNSDDLLHNVHVRWIAPEPAAWFNLATPTKGMSVRRPVDRAGVARAVCDAGHTWMLAYLLVFDHPHHTVTDSEGRFRLSALPSGARTVRVWHEGWEVVGDVGGRPELSLPIEQTTTVTISPDAEASVEVEIRSSR